MRVVIESPACFACGTRTSTPERPYSVREIRVLGRPSISTRTTRIDESRRTTIGSAVASRHVVSTSPRRWVPVSAGTRVMSYRSASFCGAAT